MKEAQLAPSADTLNSMIIACSKAGQLDRAFGECCCPCSTHGLSSNTAALITSELWLNAAIFEYMMEDGDAVKLPTKVRRQGAVVEHERARLSLGCCCQHSSAPGDDQRASLQLQ